MINNFGGVWNSSQLRCSPFGSTTKRVSGFATFRPNTLLSSAVCIRPNHQTIYTGGKVNYEKI